MKRKWRGSPLSAAVVALTVLSGCAVTVPENDPGATTSTPAPGPDTSNPGDNPDQAAGRRVELYTSSDRLIINDFRIDFAKMRNIYALFGFYPDQWETMQQVPFSAIREFQIRDIVDVDTFDRIFKNREDFQLNRQEIFKVVVTTVGGETFDYIAIIPRIRGFKDGQRWELPMAGNSGRIERILINS
jgi:hypothetical protein